MPPQLLDPAMLLSEANVKQGITMADFGCGTVGHFVFPAARLVGPSGKVYAIDIQKGVLSAIESRAKLENLTNVEPLWADMERPQGVRLADGLLDVGLLINNLFLSRKREDLAEEVRRTIKAGGTLLVVDWKETQTPLGPAVQERVGREVAKTLFSAHGFVLDHEFSAGEHHWGLVFKKAM